MADINKETAVKIKYSFINHLDSLKLYQKVFNLQIQHLNFAFTTNNKMNSCKKNNKNGNILFSAMYSQLCHPKKQNIRFIILLIY